MLVTCLQEPLIQRKHSSGHVKGDQRALAVLQRNDPWHSAQTQLK